MEVEEEEARICRLCGQCGSIYIDVFGEEGTKRLLGLKIHTKINILIDERDALPKVICVQCLGKLEFVCDFQEECLRTQQLLRDRYNLPTLTDVDEIKTDNAAASTSTSKNGSGKNQQISDNDGVDKQEPLHASQSTEKLQRNERSQQETESVTKNTTVVLKAIKSVKEKNVERVQNVESCKTVDTRRLRGRGNAEESRPTIITENITEVPIASRLRSRSDITENTVSTNSSSSNQNPPKQTQEQESNMIQIPTSTLNKVLTTVANSPNMEVFVKEATNRGTDQKDISYTVELRKKQNTESVTVLAKVFPDQGSCMVDPGIVGLLENQNGVEIRNIVNTIFNRNPKEGTANFDEFEDPEEKLDASKNPEDLFRMDGEEIQVDDNVEHISMENQSSYACRICRKVYERKDKCTVHVKTHLGIKQFVCIVCRAKFVCKSDVMKHIRCSHTNPRPIQCPKCPKRFRSKFDLTEHDNIHKGVKPYRCPDCGLSYHHKVSLQMHLKSHLPPQNLECEYCSKLFPFRTRLLSHIASVHLKSRRKFRCHFCYNLYSSLSVLNEHIKSRHVATHTCNICGKTFKVASKYKAHMLQHTNPKPFICNICNNRYASKAYLNEHLLKHEGLRKHVCQKCGARFAQASHLAAHRYVHEEKKHACSVCGRKFNRQDNMKVHRRRHFEDTKKNEGKSKDLRLSDKATDISIHPNEK